MVEYNCLDSFVIICFTFFLVRCAYKICEKVDYKKKFVKLVQCPDRSNRYININPQTKNITHKQNNRNYIVLPIGTPLCPIKRVDVNRSTGTRFDKMYLGKSQEVRIYDDIYVVYKNIIYLVHGYKPFDGEEQFNNYLSMAKEKTCGGNDPNVHHNVKSQYDVVLQKKTEYYLDYSVDTVGIVQTLDTDQTFRIKPGSKIIVPKGSVLSHTGYSSSGSLLSADESDILLLDNIECTIITQDKTFDQEKGCVFRPYYSVTIQTQHVQAQHVQAQPVQAETVQAKPVQAETVQVQPVQTKPIQAETVQAQKEEPVTTVKPTIVKSGDVGCDFISQDSVKPTIINSDLKSTIVNSDVKDIDVKPTISNQDNKDSEKKKQSQQ